MARSRPQSRAVAALLTVLFLALALVGCNRTRAFGRETGSAEVRVRADALSLQDVDRVTIRVSGPAIQPDVVVTLPGDPESGWSGVVDSIPVGGNRTFVARAFDASDVLLYEGTAEGVTIKPKQRAFVLIVLQQKNAPPPFENAVPRFESLVVSSNTVAPGQKVQLSAVATDPNPGDVLSYSWTADGGTFANPSKPDTRWTAPDTPGSYELVVSATDPHNATASLGVSITVAVPTGEADIGIEFNTWPVISELVPTPTRVDVGESTSLSLVATDPDGDPLTFVWTANCAGSFDDAATEDPSFTIAQDNGGADCALSVSVSDGRGGTTKGTIAVQTGPAISIEIGEAGSGAGGSSGGGAGGNPGGGAGGGPGGAGNGGGGQPGGGPPGGTAGGIGTPSCWFHRADSSVAGFVAGAGVIYDGSSSVLGWVQKGRTYHADGSMAGWFDSTFVFTSGGAVQGMVRGDTIYDADESVVGTIGGTIYGPDQSVIGWSTCDLGTTVSAVMLLGMF
jgi:hypothetical protein